MHPVCFAGPEGAARTTAKAPQCPPIENWDTIQPTTYSIAPTLPGYRLNEFMFKDVFALANSEYDYIMPLVCHTALCVNADMH
jgi:hypothetical protein